jgi:hypothetical protein
MPTNASLLPYRKITGTNDVRTKRFEVIKALLHRKHFGREIHALARCALLAENEPKRSRFAKMQVVPQCTVHLKPETYLRSKKRAAVLSIRKSAIYFFAIVLDLCVPACIHAESRTKNLRTLQTGSKTLFSSLLLLPVYNCP